MKYCEKCGNKIKDEYKFCDRCGAKVKEIGTEDNKKESKKEEKIDNKKVNTEDIITTSNHKKKKNGRGKIIFLTILNIILLVSTIVFLFLWLTKTSNTTCENENSSKNNTNYNSNKKEEKKDEKLEKPYIGKWEQNVDYKKGNEVVKRVYGMIEIKNDGSFNSVFYDKDDMSNSEKISGTYKVVDNNELTLTYYDEGEKDTATLYIKNGKMCIESSYCDNYLVKDSYNNKIVIYEDYDTSDIEYIEYEDYMDIINEKRNAIVVVVHDGCSYCEMFESVAERIYEDYITPVYYYENDGKLNVSGTPTTFIIKNGEIVDEIYGYKDYSSVKKILDNNDVF